MKRIPTTLIIIAFACATSLALADDQNPPAQTTPPSGKHMPAAHGASHSASEPVWFEHMDTNGDHKISRQEYLDAMGQRFDKLDANHDGEVDMQEWQRVREQMEKMLHQHHDMMKGDGKGAPEDGQNPPGDDAGGPPR